EGVVADAGVLFDDQELYAALPAHVPVERVIVGTGDHDMLHVDRAAKHFDAVIQATVYLHMAHDGAVATAAEGKAVEFVVAGNFVAGKLDARVLEQAATAGRVITAEGAATVAGRNAFNARIGDIDRRAAEQYHATPVTGAPRTHRLGAAE